MVARGYQILLWATRKKTSFSPLGYQNFAAVWLGKSAIGCSHLQLSLLPSSASLLNWHTLQIAALDVLCRMCDKYRHCNCRLIPLLVASAEATLTGEYRFV